MTAPLSLSRVTALLQRLSPTFPLSDPETSVGKELGSVAVPLGMAADAVDSIEDEMFPDTAVQTLPRWEGITRVPSRPSDSNVARQGRVVSVLRRTNGTRIDQLANMLATPFDTNPNYIVFVEMLRLFIDNMTTLSLGELDAPMPYASSIVSCLPGNVDDTGVRVTITMALAGAASFVLTSPDGTTWTFAQTGVVTTLENRTAFLGLASAGVWTLSCTDATASQALTEWSLTISNDIDSGQIYNFFALRDPSLSGQADLVEAQRLFHATALAHMRSNIIETLALRCDDPYSLCDRDPLGE